MTPSLLFSLLRRHLDVRHGAILVRREETDELTMHASVGLDVTSRRKLRLPIGSVADLVADGRVRFVVGDDRTLFQPYLSRRMYEQMRRAVLFPFFHGRTILALLVLFDSPFLALPEQVLRVLLASLSDSANQLLFDGRHVPASRVQGSLVFPAKSAVLALESFQGVGVGHVEVRRFELDLSTLVAAVRATEPFLETHRLVEDLQQTIATLVHDVARVVVRSQSTLLLLVQAQPELDMELVTHQLNTVLGSLFGLEEVHLDLDVIDDADDVGDEPDDDGDDQAQ